MSKWFINTFVILQIIGLFLSTFLIGKATDFVKVGEYKEWMFVLGCLASYLPVVFACGCFWIKCIKASIRREKK